MKPAAVRDLDRLGKFEAVMLVDAMERHLMHEPRRESKSRIKKLIGLTNPDYRLRVGDYRVFYVVEEDELTVNVLRVMHKNQTIKYYEEVSDESSADG